MPPPPAEKNATVTTPRYRRSSVRAVLETLTHDHAAANAAHDALWAALWNRRYEDVDEPVWLPDSAYSGILAFARRFPEGTTLTGIDTGESFVVFRNVNDPPPIGSRVRVLPSDRDQWRFGEGGHVMGLQLDLRFDDHASSGDSSWVAHLREGVQTLSEGLDAQREHFAARRTQLGALNEPSPLEEIWRDELAAISERISLETDYTAEEHKAIQKARSRGPRYADEEERRIATARRKRFTERGNEAISKFKEERWPAIREAAAAELRKYEEYRTEVVKLEDAMTRLRSLNDRAMKAYRMLDAIESAGFGVRKLSFDKAHLSDPAYAEEMLRTIELLYAAIPQRVQGSASSFSAYRAPTAGPSVIPPRV